MTNQSSDLSFIPSPEAAASFHDDGVVILHTGKGSLFTANRIGARIWRGIEQQLSSEAIANGNQRRVSSRLQHCTRTHDSAFWPNLNSRR
jgi:hypothetical protein